LLLGVNDDEDKLQHAGYLKVIIDQSFLKFYLSELYNSGTTSYRVKSRDIIKDKKPILTAGLISKAFPGLLKLPNISKDTLIDIEIKATSLPVVEFDGNTNNFSASFSFLISLFSAENPSESIAKLSGKLDVEISFIDKNGEEDSMIKLKVVKVAFSNLNVDAELIGNTSIAEVEKNINNLASSAIFFANQFYLIPGINLPFPIGFQMKNINTKVLGNNLIAEIYPNFEAWSEYLKEVQRKKEEEKKEFEKQKEKNKNDQPDESGSEDESQ